MTENNKLALTKKELNHVFLRSYQALGCYTYDKQQGIGFMRAMVPALEQLYPNHEDFVEALKRHNTMFNTTCAFVPFCLGISWQWKKNMLTMKPTAWIQKVSVQLKLR